MAPSDDEQEGLHRLEVVEHLQHQQRHQRRLQQRRLHNRTEKKFQVEKKLNETKKPVSLFPSIGPNFRFSPEKNPKNRIFSPVCYLILIFFKLINTEAAERKRREKVWPKNNLGGGVGLVWVWKV